MNYDLVVIGAGAAGLNVAVPAAKLGLQTLLVDRRPENLGGECLNTGCVPSKALLHVARLRKNAARLARFGISVNGSIDYGKVFDYVREVQAEIRRHESPEFLRSLGLDLAFGSARFVSPEEIEVEGRRRRARRFVLATGSRPQVPEIAGIGQVAYLTNETLFDLQTLPARLLVLGGGPIGVEMAQAFARLGSAVTLVERESRILARDAEEAALLMEQRLAEDGVTLLCGAELVEFPSSRSARIRQGDRLLDHDFDQVLIGVGRRLDFSSLDLGKAGIRLRDGKLELDSHLATSNSRVYACGDAAGQIYLTHVTELHGSVILWNLFSPLKKKVDYDHLSWVTFTDPEVATFGLSERDLRQRGIDYRKVVQSFEDVNRAATDQYPESRLIVYLKGGRLLGGTMIAPGAGELIQELILARQNEIPLRKFLDKVYPYPTATRINRWLAIYEYDRKITETVRKALRFVFRLAS